MLSVPVFKTGPALCRSRYGADEGQPSCPAHPTGKCSPNSQLLGQPLGFSVLISCMMLQAAAGRKVSHRSVVPIGAWLLVHLSGPLLLAPFTSNAGAALCCGMLPTRNEQQPSVAGSSLPCCSAAAAACGL